jgi:hypothetical protein
MNLKDLAVDHDYYASDSNYYSKDAHLNYSSWKYFYYEFGDADVDLNLVYRWDVHKTDQGSYWMEVFIIGQRKGKYIPVHIESVSEDDVPQIIEYLTKHWLKLNSIWLPLSEISAKPSNPPH